VTTTPRRSGHLPTVLIAGSDDARRAELLDVLTVDGFECIEGPSVDEAVAAVGSGEVGAVILALLLPGPNDGDVGTALRRACALPLLVASDVHDAREKVEASGLGAEDDVTTPLATGDVAPRAQVQPSGSVGPAGPVVAHDVLRIDLAAREATLDGRVVDLTRREFDLLAFLAATPRRAFSRDELLRHVWSSCDQWQDPATVTEHVRRIRRKIERDPQNPRWITTVRSVGYRFEPAPTP
jgi:DNA-binding response OmpR family regulator